MGKNPELIPLQVDHLLTISRQVSQAVEWKPALDEIFHLVRSLLIFDNLVVYLFSPTSKNLDVMYARAVGRGRSAEADASWGDQLASQIVTDPKVTLLAPPSFANDIDRLRKPYLLGLPLATGQRVSGVLIFIRFGGPEFSPSDVDFAQFISQQITHLIERQNLVNEYKELEREHEQSRLMSSFVSTISHELRSPLGFIKGYTTTLLRSDTNWDQATQAEFLQIIDQATDRLEELIDNLLDSSRLQSGQMKMHFQPLRVDSLINDVILRSKHHFPKLEARLEIQTPLQSITGDPRRLSQVIENLLSNAAKYASGYPVRITMNQDRNQVEICVIDHGPGIAEKYIPFVFDRFFRSPETPNIPGSGLGLYICKEIVHAHHGEITVKSKAGEGTTFFIRLPNNPTGELIPIDKEVRE